MTEIIKQNLINHLNQIIRERDPYIANGGHFFIKEYIRQEFRNFGHVESHPFIVKGKSFENIVLKLNPNLSNPLIVIGAHYDTVPGSPGADDNGSGVAVLLELARIFSENLPTNYPIQLVAFDLEEYGLLGSAAYAKQLKEQKQALRLMFSLEMLGYCDHRPNSQRYPAGLKYFYPSTGNFIALVGNIEATPDLRKLSQNIRQTVPCEWLPVPLKGYPIPDTRRSDHVPFWDLGYNAIMVTDTANMRNPYYHSPKDTLDTLDLDFLQKVCQGLALAIQSL
ncbi:peptidase M28 [Aphanothece hegewaldii CCALA 016]|uniref:Peptidase M28 n=1 Tax=Aphanothece hegewaldii CCALA 016 TaxID=2107694 RepID=A0A2T1M3Z3_9CHRO|nr:M28 family peptidase [Aphanothece hegewaldii]PSF39563.1 peptidase M28 [Aphanothece hegewaldii CCALA 016]